ncbi:MAG TPA: hypothetical protein VF177_17005 [Anaerolineae bacterium]
MRLEKKRDEELAERKGMTGKTIIQIVWLLISFVIAYFLSVYLFEQEVITYNMLYTQLAIPRDVPREALLGGLMLLIVMVMQMFLILGFVIASPEGRRRTGEPSLRSRKKDPFDDQWYGR